MKHHAFKLASVVVAATVTVATVAAAPQDPAWDSAKVIQILKENLPGVTEPELEQALVRGVVQQFNTRVQIVTNRPPEGTRITPPTLATTNLFDQRFAWVRVAQVAPGLASNLTSVVAQLDPTNGLRGLVLDLRFATGSDYQAAGEAAARFAREPRPLLDWGAGSYAAVPPASPWSFPVVVLVNRGTAEAAEALAAAVQALTGAVVIGGRTSGDARAYREFPLTAGYQLRLAGAPLKVGGGTTLGAEGLTPDILVELDPKEERVFLESPGQEVTAGGAPGGGGRADAPGARRLLNEAELMRRQRGGRLDDPTAAPVSPVHDARSAASVRDPSLARGLDLLKALSRLRGPEAK